MQETVQNVEADLSLPPGFSVQETPQVEMLRHCRIDEGSLVMFNASAKGDKDDKPSFRVEPNLGILTGKIVDISFAEKNFYSPFPEDGSRKVDYCNLTLKAEDGNLVILQLIMNDKYASSTANILEKLNQADLEKSVSFRPSESTRTAVIQDGRVIQPKDATPAIQKFNSQDVAGYSAAINKLNEFTEFQFESLWSRVKKANEQSAQISDFNVRPPSANKLVSLESGLSLVELPVTKMCLIREGQMQIYDRRSDGKISSLQKLPQNMGQLTGVITNVQVETIGIGKNPMSPNLREDFLLVTMRQGSDEATDRTVRLSYKKDGEASLMSAVLLSMLNQTKHGEPITLQPQVARATIVRQNGEPIKLGEGFVVKTDDNADSYRSLLTAHADRDLANLMERFSEEAEKSVARERG